MPPHLLHYRFRTSHCQVYFPCQDGTIRAVATLSCTVPTETSWTFRRPSTDTGTLLPSIAVTDSEDAVVFASDIGYIYVVNASSGVLIQQLHAAATARLSGGVRVSQGTAAPRRVTRLLDWPRQWSQLSVLARVPRMARTS